MVIKTSDANLVSTCRRARLVAVNDVHRAAHKGTQKLCTNASCIRTQLSRLKQHIAAHYEICQIEARTVTTRLAVVESISFMQGVPSTRCLQLKINQKPLYLEIKITTYGLVLYIPYYCIP